MLSQSGETSVFSVLSCVWSRLVKVRDWLKDVGDWVEFLSGDVLFVERNELLHSLDGMK